MTGIRAKLRDDGSRTTGPLRFDPSARPVNSRRRSWIAVGLVLVLLSALTGGIVLARIADRQPVLALAQPIERGEILTNSHLRVVEVAAEEDLGLVPADQGRELVGLTATGPLPAGTLIAKGTFTDGSIIPDGWEVVGLALGPGAYPVGTLRPGDHITVVETPDPATTATAGEREDPVVLVRGAEVYAVEPVGELTGTLMISIAVPDEVSADIASAAAQDRVRLVLEAGR